MQNQDSRYIIQVPDGPDNWKDFNYGTSTLEDAQKVLDSLFL